MPSKQIPAIVRTHIDVLTHPRLVHFAPELSDMKTAEVSASNVRRCKITYMSGISKTWICIHNLGCLVFFLCCIRINKGPPGLELQVQNLSNITSILLRLRFAVHGLQCLIVPCLCFAAVLVLTYNTKEKVKYKDIYSCP